MAQVKKYKTQIFYGATIGVANQVDIFLNSSDKYRLHSIAPLTAGRFW
jgi:hypothetical protein